MNRVAFKISMFYMLIGVLWILGSDQFALHLSNLLSKEFLTLLQSAKGITHIFLTSALLYLLVKKFNKRLEQSEKRYRKLFNESPIPKLLLNEDTYQIIEANQAACVKYGFTKQEFHHLNIQSLCPEPATKFEDWINLHQNKNHEPNLVAHKKKDGSRFYVQPYSFTLQDNGCRLVVALDVQDKIEAEKKKNEALDQLIERERFFRSLIDSQNHYLIRIDANGCYTYANNRFSQKTGFSHEELMGMHYQKTVVPEDWSKCQEVEKLCEEKPGTIISIEIRKINKEGIISWVNWEFIGITNEQGEIDTIQGVGQDVTAQKLTELEAQQALEQYNMIAKATNDVAYDWNFQTMELNWTKATLTSMLYQDHEVEETIQWWEERVHPEERARITSDLYQAIKDRKESWDCEYRFLCGDKQYRFFYERGYILYNKKKEPVRMVGLMQDIQKQKAAQKEITKLSLVAQKTQNSVIISDKHGKIEWVNEGFTRQTGFSLEEVIGKKPGNILQGPATDKNTVKTIREKLQQKEKFTAELINYRKDGSSYWMRMFISPIFNEKGELVQYIAIETDITERKQFIAKLERQNTQLKEIAWISSHEIRRPVASILGLISLYDQEQPNRPFNQEIIRHLTTTTRELDQVIHRIVNKTYEVEELNTPYSEGSAETP